MCGRVCLEGCVCVRREDNTMLRREKVDENDACIERVR